MRQEDKVLRTDGGWKMEDGRWVDTITWQDTYSFSIFNLQSSIAEEGVSPCSI